MRLPYNFLLRFRTFRRRIHRVQSDLIYHATPLLNVAKDNNFDYVHGKDMLVYQGAKSFELWTELEAPIKLMKNAIEV